MPATQVFECPTCGAPLDYPIDGAPSIRCPFCHNTILVPQAVPESGPAPEPTQPAVAEILRLARSGQQAEAVKRYSRLLRTGLDEAVEDVEKLTGGENVFRNGYLLHADASLTAVPFPAQSPDLPQWTAQDMLALSRLVRAGQKIEAIQLLRRMFPIGLKDASDAVEAMQRGEAATFANATIQADGQYTLSSSAPVGMRVSPENTAELMRQVAAGNKIEAIRIFREMYDVSLKQAKDAVEAMMAGQPLPASGSRAAPAESAPPVKKTNLVFLVIGIAVALITLGILVPLVLVPATRGAISQQAGESAERLLSPTPAATLAPSSTPGFAQVVLSFGGEGSGAGLFTDARSIAVDGEGLIYVGEYQGGRIQVFDPAGKFLTQFMVDSVKPLKGLSAGLDGRLYVVQGGDITVYDGDLGQVLSVLPRGENTYYEDAVPALDGGLLAFSYYSQDDILRLGPDYQVRLTIPEAVSSRASNSGMGLRLALDGNDHIYALSFFNEAVFKFSPQGEFVTRFGSQGDAPGQFRAPEAIAVDGQGRVYVSDMTDLLVFAPDGRYLTSIPVDGVAFGLAFDSQGYLYVAARTKMYKFEIMD